MEVKNKFFIESITFTTLKLLNAQVLKKYYTFDFLTYVAMTQVNIYHKKIVVDGSIHLHFGLEYPL